MLMAFLVFHKRRIYFSLYLTFDYIYSHIWLSIITSEHEESYSSENGIFLPFYNCKYMCQHLFFPQKGLTIYFFSFLST